MESQPEGIHVVKKESLPAKVCKVCGEMIERTRRAKPDWNQIQYCSAVCRRMGVAYERVAAAG
jgi:hypothetical protein